MNKKLLIALAAAALFVSSNAQGEAAENGEGDVTETTPDTTETTPDTTGGTTEPVVETPEDNTTTPAEEASGSDDGGKLVFTENAEVDLGDIGEGDVEQNPEETNEIVDNGEGTSSTPIDGSGTGDGDIMTDDEALDGKIIVTSGAALLALAALLV